MQLIKTRNQSNQLIAGTMVVEDKEYQFDIPKISYETYAQAVNEKYPYLYIYLSKINRVIKCN